MPKMTRVPFPVTGSAISSAIVQTGVLFVVRMPLRAMRLSSVLCRVVEASKNIYVVGNRLQMVGVNAMAHTTQMIKFQPLRNRPDKKLIGKAMGSNHVPVDLEASVTTSIFSFGPEPTRAKLGSVVGDGATLADLGPKTFFGRPKYTCGAQGSQWVAMPLPTLVVHTAPAALEGAASFTSRDRTCRLWSHREFTPRGVIGPGVCASRPFSILPQMGQEVQL